MNAFVLGLALVANTASPSVQPNAQVPAVVAAPVIERAIAKIEIAREPGPRAEFQPPGMFGPPYTTRFRPQHVKSPRLRSAVAGAGVGLLAGAAIGFLAMNRDGCDTCGLGGIAVGMPIGSVIGTVIGANWPR
jgi:hypothetical protein